MLRKVSGWIIRKLNSLNLRLTLKVFHNVQKAVIYVRMITELHFDLIEIAQSVLQKIKSAS